MVFAPGESFYADRSQAKTMRLNVTQAEPHDMARGIGILSEEVRALMSL